MRCAVIAGGTASRFAGRPKGLERVGGERILDRVVNAVQAAAGQPPLLVANAPDAAKWRPGLKVQKDLIANCGSLGGIYTALASGEGPVLVVAWDMPFVSIELLEALIKGAEGSDVYLPESGARRGVEPLCGVYGPACVAPIKAQLESEDFQATGFHDKVKVGRLSAETLTKFGSPDVLFFNVNTPDELAKAEDMWRQRG